MRPEPTLVTGTFVRMVNGVAVESGYAYMAAPVTIWDAELIAWAENRERMLKARRAKASA